MAKHVVIVGGGLSGLAAAIHLASRSVRVTILEQKPAPGGRAYSFRDKVTGDTIDNGQHVLIAGYDRTMRFLETIGTRDLLRTQPIPLLRFHHPIRGFCEFRLSRLPVPLNLLTGILSTSLLTFGDRIRLLRAGMKLVDTAGSIVPRLTIGEWLRSMHQSPEAIRSFWEPLAVSIMNESIDRASAALFVGAMRKAFLGRASDAAIAMPTVGLSQLYVDHAVRHVLLRGGEVRCNSAVTGVSGDADHFLTVDVRGADPLRADAVISAVPPQGLLSFLPFGVAGEYSHLEAITSSPIVSIHLWFERDVMPHDSVGLIGRRVQWLFNRRLISHEHGAGAHLSAVMSGAHQFVGMTKDELVEIALTDVRSAYPQATERPYHAVVIREKHATFSSSPDAERLRPGAVTGIRGFFLAGDWTATGYPATIEGAVQSGEIAAVHTLEYLGAQAAVA
jgi:hydroxysqualene dehydroxylase